MSKEAKLSQAALAKELELSTGYVAKLCQAGMPRELSAAKLWLEAKRANKLRKLPAHKRSAAVDLDPAPAPVQINVDGLTAGTLSVALQRHRILVDDAREVYSAAIQAGDPAQSKLQTAYNQSLRTLVYLEDEEKKRAIEAGDYIKIDDAKAIISSWTAKVVQRLDKLPLEAAEGCNPDRPEVAIKALEKWVINSRADLADITL